MKKSIILIAVGVFVMSVALSSAIAAEEKLTVDAYASSYYAGNFVASKAIDGNYNSYWYGGMRLSPWWFVIDLREVKYVTKVVIKWKDVYYKASNYDIQITDENTYWPPASSYTGAYIGISGVFSADGEIRDINQDVRFVKLIIYSTSGPPMPGIREIEVYGGSAPPPPTEPPPPDPGTITVPRFIRFQGNLADVEGLPLNGTFTLTFALYDVEIGGTALWEEVQANIDIEKGFLDVKLGSVTPLDLPFDKQYWLGVQVESDNEMTPRFELTTVPYAFTSEK